MTDEGGWDPDEVPHHTDDDCPEWDLPLPATYKLEAPPPPAPAGDGRARTSWWPTDLTGLFDGSVTLPEPELFTRADNQPILYPGKAHAFNGESESGKSWAALLACVQAIRLGLHVLYLDFEDTAATVVTRLLALGAKPDEIVAYFHYSAPTEPMQLRNGKPTGGYLDLVETLEVMPLALAVIDGVTEAMTLHGYKTNENDDYAAFHSMLPRRLSRAGAASVQIDHVTKDREGRGRYAIGAQHKLAGMDGAVFSFEVTSPFGLGLHGIARITIAKDRPGQLRRHAAGVKHCIAELHLRSDPDTHALAAALEAPDTGPGGDLIPTWWMEQISRAVETDGPLTTNQVDALTKSDGKKGSTEHKREARRLLQSGGFVRAVRQGQSLLWTHLKPYREGQSDGMGSNETF